MTMRMAEEEAGYVCDKSSIGTWLDPSGYELFIHARTNDARLFD